jgi:hypothetical protein
MRKRDVFKSLPAVILLAVSGLLLGPGHVLAHGDQLITAFTWFGVLPLGALQWTVWSFYNSTSPRTKGSRFGLLASSAACMYGALYECWIAGELHYGHAKAYEYGPALILAGISGAGIYECLRSRRLER